jgi:hypothetical protein
MNTCISLLGLLTERRSFSKASLSSSRLAENLLARSAYYNVRGVREYSGAVEERARERRGKSERYNR